MKIKKKSAVDEVADKNKEIYFLRLYITGASVNSAKAVTNLKKICEEHLKDRYKLEVVDVYQQGVLAAREQIVALPLLVKMKPLPEHRLIGDMSDTVKVMKGLGLLI